MKLLYFVIILFTYTYVAHAQLPGGICNWNEDKKATVVLTFDDWTPGQGPIVIPELEKRNLVATFFIMNTTASHSWNLLVAAAQNGNEIANHTKTHPHLKTITDNELQDEIRGMKILIDQHCLQNGITFAYPFGEYNLKIMDTVKSSNHIAARSAQPPGNYSYTFASTLNEYFRIPTYFMGPDVSVTTFESELKKITAGGGLLTFMYHSVDDDTNSHGDTWYAQVKQTELQKQLDALLRVKDVIWLTTFAQAIKYHKERTCATLRQTQAPNGTTWKLNLTDTLSDNLTYNQPLSIKLKTSGVRYKTVTQNGITSSIDFIHNDSILFHAIPDHGEIILSTISKQ